MATADFIGWFVALDCGADGQYVGTVKAVDGKALTITLKDALLNGEPLPKDARVSSNKIVDLKVIELNPQPPATNKRVSKTVAVNGKNKANAVAVDGDAKPTGSKPEKKNEKPAKKTEPTSSDSAGILQKLMVTPSAAPPQTGVKLLKRGDPVPVKNEPKPAAQQKETKKPAAPAVEKAKPAAKPVQEKVPKKPNQPLETIKPPYVKTDTVTRQSPIASLAALPTPQLSPPTPPTNGPSGIRLDPHSLISSLASVSLSSSEPKKVQKEQQQPQKEQQQPRSSSVSGNGGTPSSSTANLGYKKFGEFKSFKGKQHPVPCALDGDGSNTSSRRAGRGTTSSPSGVPITDFSNGYGRVHKRNRDLGDPIDYEEMSRDFDFDGNLALFAKEEVNDTDESDEAHSEAPAHVRNFRYDENIVQDATRVTSWTSTMESSLPLKHVSLFETIDDGGKIPVLDDRTKSSFINLVKSKLGPVNYYTRVADRLFNLFTHIIDHYSLRITGSVIILGSGVVHESLLHNLSLHLSNRRIETKLVDCEVKPSLPHVETVSAKELQAVKNVQFVIILDFATAERLGLTWLARVANSRKPAHVIDFECERPGFTFSHALYLSVLNENVLATKNYERRPNRFVADVGIPYTWFEKEASDALADVFSKGLLVEV